MQKRAGIARAMALDPEILFFDESSAGLDPDAPMMVELENSLQEISVSAMSRSPRQLADSLEEQPEILLRGKKSSGGK